MRAAEMALWESTGGDVLSSDAAGLFRLATAGTPKS
jgi:hypothetical protein